MREIIKWTRTSVMVAGLAALPLAAQTAGQPQGDTGRNQTPATQNDPRNLGEPGTGMGSPGAIGTSPDASRPGYGAGAATDIPAGAQDMGRTSPVDYERDRQGFNWGWLGLLGLAGLAGMRHRHAHRHDDVRNDSVPLDKDRV
jgi:hypothetical protein